MRNERLRLMVEIAMMAALTSILGMIRLYRLPQGGSITLAMLPIFLIAFRHGVKVGLITGLIAGTLKSLPNPVILHPIQFLLDYTLAYTVLGVAGAFRKNYRQMLFGIWLGGSLRYACSVTSGVVFFKQYAPEGMNPLAYSLSVNLTYLVPSLLLVTLVIYLLPAVLFRPAHSYRGVENVKETA